MVGTKTGQAFIYDRSDLTVPEPRRDYLDILAQQTRARTRARGQQRVQPADLPDLEDMDFYYKHTEQIQGQLNDLYEMNADLRAAGVADPSTGTDAGSRLYQKRRNELLIDARNSTQLQEEYKEARDVLAKQTGSFAYRDEDAAALRAYFEDVPLSEHRTGEIPIPMLRVKEPDFVLLDYYTGLAKKLKDGGKTEYGDDEVMQIAAETLGDPNVDAAITSIFSDISDEQADALDVLAAQRGVTPATLLSFAKLRPLISDPTSSYDIDEVINTFMPDPSASTREDGDRTTTWKGYPESRKQASAELVADQPGFTQALVAQGLISAGRSEEETKQAATAYARRVMDARLGTVTSTTFDEEGGYGGIGREQYIARRSQWLDDIMSNNPDRVINAAGYLNQTETTEGTTISELRIAPRQLSPGTPDGVHLIAKGSRQVKDEFGEYVSRPDEESFYPGAMTRESLAAWYDKAFFGVHKKTPYGVDSDTRGPQPSGSRQRGLGRGPGETPSPSDDVFNYVPNN